MKTITTADEHKAAILRISDLMDENPEAGSDDATELQELAQACEAYEGANHNLDDLTVEEVMKPYELEPGTPLTHILFYFDVYKGKDKEVAGDYKTLRAWANKQHEMGNIRGNWEIEKL